MNIIGNDCTVGFLYRELNLEYKNPFIWVAIDFENFLKLIENYDKINFKNITNVQLVVNKTGTSVQNEIYPILTIDNTIDIHFRHHFLKEGKHAEKNTQKRYIYDENIVEYVKNIYMRRAEKMTEPPIFVWNDRDRSHLWYKSNLSNFNNIKTNYKIIIYTSKSFSSSNPNVTVLYKEELDHLVEKNAINLSKVIKKYLPTK